MRKALAALAAALIPALAAPALADTLLDNVDGVTLGQDGRLVRFSGLLIDDDGRIAQVLQRKDKRPRRTDFVIDGKGRFVIPGLIDSHIRLMDVALAALSDAQVGQAMPAPRPEDRDVALGKVQRLLAAQGITAVADMGTTIEDWQTYRRAGDKGGLYLRIMAYAADIPTLALIAGPRPTPWLYDDRLRAGGLHLVLDGPFETRSAALNAPYADAPVSAQVRSGTMRYNDTQLRNLMSRAAMDGFQLAVSAHGDAASASVLGAFTELSLTYGTGRRWRIEAMQLAAPADMAEYGRLGAIASLAPGRLADESKAAEARLGSARLGELQPWRSLAQGGAKLVFGSGEGNRPQAPLAAVAAAISREDENGQPFGGWQPQERLADRVDALAAYSADGAFAGFADGRFGRLVEGERADFVMLGSDPLLAPPSELRTMRVVETWIGGRKIYDAFAPPPAEASPPVKQLPAAGLPAAVVPAVPAPAASR
jgi:predicted amidohydrolase YtcJ